MKLLSRALALAVISCFASFAANASNPSQLPPGQCDVTVVQNGDVLAKPACSANPPSQYLAVTTSTYNPWLGITTTAYQAVRSDWGPPLVPVDVWNMCRYINNNSPGTGSSIFVPFKSSHEWQNFVAVAGSASLPYIALSTCAVPWQPPTPAADTQAGDPQYCGSPTLSAPPPPLPYAQTSTSYQQSPPAQYSCTCADGVTKWAQAAANTYYAGNSDNQTILGGPQDSQGGWRQTTPANCTGSLINNVCYTGAVPDGCGGGDGQCGPANGVASQNPPSGDSNLCTAGTPSAVTQDGNSNWIWTCTGSGSGPNNVANCSAPTAICPAKKVQDTAYYCNVVPNDGHYPTGDYEDPSVAPFDNAPCQVEIIGGDLTQWGNTYSQVVNTNLPDGYLNQNYLAVPWGALFPGVNPGVYFGWSNSFVDYICTSTGWQKQAQQGGGGGCCPSCCCGPGCHIVSK